MKIYIYKQKGTTNDNLHNYRQLQTEADMLTRLAVKGFKNLVDIDVYFGPFTCIAGSNGVGKSNLFDAILFLQALADKTFIEAAMSIRGGENIKRLFTAHSSYTMNITAEIIIPKFGIDNFGQKAEASSTFVRYSLILRYIEPHSDISSGDIIIEKEDLTYIPKGKSARELMFFHKPIWREQIIHSDRRAPYITTDNDAGIIKLHQDRLRTEGKKKRGGATWEFPLSELPRTVLSSAQNAKEAPTAVLVRQEMRSWKLLQLEPSALRDPDSFQSPSRIASNGAHMPSTLYKLATKSTHKNTDIDSNQYDVYTKAANRLSELVDGIGEIKVDKDDKRQLLTLYMTDKNNVELPAGSLSDGTLRFLALTIIEMDPEEGGVLCLEEPENGIHPEKIKSMLNLLQDIATDTEFKVDTSNPLRQVIINTHSPGVVALVEDEGLLFTETYNHRFGDKTVQAIEFRFLNDTKRSQSIKSHTIQRGRIISYLEGCINITEIDEYQQKTKKRVIDRFKGQLHLPI